MKTVYKHRLGGCCALVVALASCAAVAQDRNQVSETVPAPNPNWQTGSCNQSYGLHSYEDRAIWHWPLIGPLHDRWITTTKPGLQASHWGYPEYFEERPFGTDVLQAEQMQIANGLRDQQVLYQYDFYPGDGSAKLSPRGEYQLRKIVQRMQCVPSPIIIQTTIEKPELGNARRQYVLDWLREHGVAASPEMVVVDHPPLPGLQGVEGMLIYQNMLGQTRARGGGFSFDTGDGGGTAPVNIGNVTVAHQGKSRS